METQYVVETQPNAVVLDSPRQDAIKTVRYIYDLELDAQGNILGGEWYANAHPDFLWVPEPKARAVTPGDTYLKQKGLDKVDWSTAKAFPKEWQDIAQRTSEKGSPLAAVVESLIKFAKKR